MAIEWRRVPSFPCYEVSELGDVRRCAPGIRGGIVGRVLKPYRPAGGYRAYDLRRDNARFRRRAHQLVAEAFIGPRPAGMETCHNDGTRTNDHRSNLRYDTSKGNRADMVRHGTLIKGSAHHRAKLSDAQVSAIRRRCAGGESPRVVAADYGIGPRYVSRLVNGTRRAA